MALRIGGAVYLPYHGVMGVVSLLNPPGGAIRRLLVTGSNGKRYGMWDDDVVELHSQKCGCRECCLTRARNHDAKECDCQLHEFARSRWARGGESSA